MTERYLHAPSRLLLPILLLFTLLAGCGHKGPVRPLLQPLPAAPGALSLEQRGERLLVAWNLPRTNQDGSPLTDLAGFRVYKMRYDPAQDCPECRDTSVLLQDVDLEYLRDVRRSGDRLYLWDDGLEAGLGYQYRVVPYNARGRDGATTQLRRTYVAPPPAPTGLTASGHDRMVRLSWEPATAAAPDFEMIGYNLYRRETDEPFPFEPVNRQPLLEPTFEDFGVQNDHTYIYTVRTLARSGGQRVESQLSTTATETPRQGQ